MKLLLICGPTACHKSETALRLAKAFDGEILSADSVAVYRGMDIGSAKPTKQEQRQVPHHLIDIASPDDGDFSVSAFQKAADAAIADISSRNKLPILVGGSGLYCDAVLENMGYALPKDPALRAELESEYDRDPQAFFAAMAADDPAAGERLHPNDKKRVVRAREVYLLCGKPFSAFNTDYQQAQHNSRYDALRIGLNMDRDLLYAAIEARVDRMIQQGLIQEAKALYDKGYDRQLPAMQAIGYAQLFAYFDGEVSLTRAILDIKQATRRFAKRQLTWFRRDDRIRWFDCGNYEQAYLGIYAYVKENLNK